MQVEIDDEVWLEYEDVLALGEAYETALEDLLDALEEGGPANVRTRDFEDNTHITTRGVRGEAADVYIVFKWRPADETVTVRAIGYIEMPPRPPR